MTRALRRHEMLLCMSNHFVFVVYQQLKLVVWLDGDVKVSDDGELDEGDCCPSIEGDV